MIQVKARVRVAIERDRTNGEYSMATKATSRFENHPRDQKVIHVH